MATTTGKKPKLKRIIALVLAAAALAGTALGVKALFFTKEERTILTEETTFGSLATTVEGTATTVPGNSSTVSAASSEAKITAVYVSAGDQVKVGDPLYDQDDSEVDDALDELQKQIDELYDQIDSFDEQIENSNSQIADYQEQIAELRETIASLKVASPLSGRVTQLHVEEGQNAQKGGSLVTVVDDSQMTLTEYFSYAYEGQIAQGMEAGVSIASLSLNLTGKVTKVEKVERFTDQGTRCFAVTVTVDNPGALTEGMTGAGWLLSADGQKLYPAIEGIKKSIGAPRWEIIVQFLIEAAILSSLGGLIGIALGYILSAVLGQAMYGVVSFPSTLVTVGAFLFSAVIGIVFGLYPAVKAANLQPVDALRSE